MSTERDITHSPPPSWLYYLSQPPLRSRVLSVWQAPVLRRGRKTALSESCEGHPSAYSLSHRTARPPRPPPNCDPAITPDISRCFRLVANGLGATTSGAAALQVALLHLRPGAPRRHGAPVASPRAHPTRAASGATASWCVAAGRLGASARLGRG
jgi:hypothetical protein